MKFTDGNWLLKPGIKASYANSIYDSRIVESIQEQELILTVPCQSIRHRGDTLRGPVLKVKIAPVCDGIIRVKISHFEGSAVSEMHFPKSNFEKSGSILIDEGKAVVDAGPLKAEVTLDDAYEIRFFAQEKVIASTASKGTGYIISGENEAYIHEGLSLDVGELVYGLGERFTSFIKNGQSIDIWNEDGGSGSDQAYKSIPFYLTNKGYGVFVDEPGRVSYEIASEKVDRCQFSVPGESLQYYVIYGPTPKEILARYTQLTGRPSLPPTWSFGLWLSTSFTTNYDEATVTEFIEGMEKRKLPLSVFHFDCFWMKGLHWVNFEWDPVVFPNPEGFLKRLKARGLKISAWINSYVAQQSELFDEAHKNGFLLKKANGDTWQWDLWQPGMGIVDFTNPQACDWYRGHLKRLIDMGVDCFKTDFGERIPTDVQWHDGSSPEKMHNYYTYYYKKLVFETLKERLGSNAIVFARSATASCQQFPVHWGGDCFSNFNSMAASVRAGLSLGLCGFGFWSHDIGGFEGMPPAEVYKRWIAFGLLSSHSRLHGSGSYRVPWIYDEEACDVLRTFTNLKCQLMPYLYGVAVEAQQTGVPVMRSMNLEFPEDQACEVLDRQYMLGPSILVAPVMSQDGWVDYYLPEGIWTHLLSREKKTGGRWYREKFDCLSLPLFVRPNTLLAMGTENQKPDYDYPNQSRIELFEIDSEMPVTVDLVDQSGEVAFRASAQVVDGKLKTQIASTSSTNYDPEWKS